MKQIQNLSIVSPGFFGLNTQESGVTISPNFAQEADNVIIDKYGRLGARKGWTMQTTSGSSQLGGNNVEFMLEHVNDDASTTVLSAGNNDVFTGGIGSSLTSIKPAAYTITANRWKGASLNDHALIVQSGYEPLVYSSAISPVCQTISTYKSGGTHLFDFSGTTWPSDVIAAYGRFWTHDGSTVYWSTDIADTTFPAFYGGTSGTLNIAAVLPNNADTIVALAAHNDFLVILCKNNIVLYSGAANPIGLSFQLNDVITGVGCVARDSVQMTGNDLIFLSDTGIRSLGRVIQEKSLPMRDFTKNVRDDFLNNMTLEELSAGSLDNVVSVYSEANAFYLISFPSKEIVYCLDMRSPLEDGSARVTNWFNYKAYSFLRRRNRDLLIGKPDGIGKYTGYVDNTSSYNVTYSSHFIDFGNPTVTKILKQIATTILGGSNQTFVIKSAFDYDVGTENSYTFTIPTTGSVSEFGVAKYPVYSEFKGTVADFASLPGSPSDGDAYLTLDNSNVYQWNAGTSTWDDVTSTWETAFTLTSSSEYTGSIGFSKVKSSALGSGNVLQIGFEATVNGTEISVQKIDAFVKTGRIS